MRQSSSFLRAAVLLVAAAIGPRLPAGESPSRSLDLKAAHQGTPQIDLALFHLAPQPQSAVEIFTKTRHAFERKPMAGFHELPEIREAAARGHCLLGGPMLGCVSEDGARVWVRTTKPAEVTVAVETPDGKRIFGPVRSSNESDLTAVVTVSGLPPGTSSFYQVLVDGKVLPLLAPVPAQAAITTTPSPASKGITRVAFGADFHKTGLWNRELLDRVPARSNIAMVLLGDLAVDDRENRVGLHRSDYLLRDLSPAWRSLAANVAIYATWDDHDYFNNDLSGVPLGFTAADRAAVRAVWHQNWNNPDRDLSNTDRGIQFRTRIGPCDLIMLDTRSQRGIKGTPDCFLGPTQARWLEEQLLACRGPFIILTSGTMWSDHISNGKDSWGTWDPAGRERLFAFIERHRIGGVLLLSGDRHGARVLQIPRPSGFRFREFELGSLGAHPGPAAFAKDTSNQSFGLTGESLFGEFEFDTTGPHPAITMRALAADGEEKYSITLTRDELTPPAAR